MLRLGKEYKRPEKPFSFKTLVRLYTSLKVNPDNLLLRRSELRDAVTGEKFDSRERVAVPGYESLLESVNDVIIQW